MGLFSRFSPGIGVDLGTANTLVYVSGKGIVLQEPSVIAVDRSTKLLVAIGTEAESMLGRTPPNIVVTRPLRDGVIAGFDIAQLMLQQFIQQVQGGKTLFSPRIVMGIPSGATGVERRALVEVAAKVGAREVYLIDEPLAAAIGAGLPVEEPPGNMIIDIGGGTTEVAVVSLVRTVLSESVRVAGDELNGSISHYLKKVHNLLIGDQTAEKIKIKIGSAYPSQENDHLTMEVCGLHLLSGLPRTLSIKGAEVRESMAEPLTVIAETVKRALEHTPPELAADIASRGIMLVGGGALLKGISTLLSHETGLVVHVSTTPLSCVGLGAGLVLENFHRLGPTLSRAI